MNHWFITRDVPGPSMSVQMAEQSDETTSAFIATTTTSLTRKTRL